MKLSRIGEAIVKDKQLPFSSIAILSLFGIWANFSVKSQLLGAIFAPLYISTNTFLCGKIFFPHMSIRFKAFYGFLIFFSLIIVSGSIAYWIRDFSDSSILVILFALTTSLFSLNKIQQLRLKHEKADYTPSKKRVKLNIWLIDLLFFFFLSLSFYFLFAARTGESISTPWSLVPNEFFISFFSATAFLIARILGAKNRAKLQLLCLALVILVPATGFLIVLRHPYATNMMAMNLELDRILATYGKFVPNPQDPEVIGSLVGKAILQVGGHIGNVAISKLFQVDPQSIALSFVPVIFIMIVVMTSFDLMSSLALEKKRLALLCSASFLASQHNVFLFTPPGKPETLALGMLLVNIMLWVRYVRHRDSRLASLVASIILLSGIMIIHQYVGLFAIFLAALALVFSALKPFHGGSARVGIGLALIGSFLLIWISGFMFLHFYVSSLIGHPVGGGIIDINTFSFSKSIEIIAPPLWFGEGSSILAQIVFTFINNSVYLTYAFIAVGVIAAFRYKLSKYWLAMTMGVIPLSLVYMVLAINFVPLAPPYRFFYYMNFLTFPLMGVGLYWLIDHVLSVKIWITFGLKKTCKLSLKPLQFISAVLILSFVFTSSVYAGYPRRDSMGPYRWLEPAFPSDYDTSALDFICEREKGRRDFFIVGDAFTNAEGVMILGYQTIPIPYKEIFQVPTLSFHFSDQWGTDELWSLVMNEPFKFLVEGVNFTNSIANRTYIILTYRLDEERLSQLFDVYSQYLGQPIYAVEGKVYVFRYDRQVFDTFDSRMLILFDDDQVENGVWQLQLVDRGNIDFTIRDDVATKVKGNNSLEVMIKEGTYGRATLRHIWSEPINLDNANYLLFYFHGYASNEKLTIVFTSQSPKDYFRFVVRDNFEGWQLLVVPLTSFVVGANSPSWAIVSEMLIQFSYGWPMGRLYIDQIAVAKSIPLQLLPEATLLP